MKTVFIDGSAGTTGLQIHQRLAQRGDVRLLTLPEDSRKDPAARREALNGCDLAFLCLPDAAAREAASMVTNGNTVLLDASTAHRTAPGWVYGLPELGPGYAEAVGRSHRIAVPAATPAASSRWCSRWWRRAWWQRTRCSPAIPSPVTAAAAKP